MSKANKPKATAEDLKTYNEFEERMNSLDPVDNELEWKETAKAGNDFVDSRDGLPSSSRRTARKASWTSTAQCSFLPSSTRWPIPTAVSI